ADKRVRLADPRLAELVVNGEFAVGDSESIVEAFADTLPLRIEQFPTELVLYAQPAADSAQL
ncbi:MAG TPA: hypothetical protein VFL30_09205, partial [Rhodanobacteraceae bacterium]|nr:hypothetical protein [Rhodanobacteraceae bacterium]